MNEKRGSGSRSDESERRVVGEGEGRSDLLSPEMDTAETMQGVIESTVAMLKNKR